MIRRDFIRSSALMGTGLSLSKFNLSLGNANFKNMDNNKSPLAITMWEFSWLERRWPGAGYEDWDKALSELKERGYNAIRMDAFPHLIYTDPYKEYLIKPQWNTQVWGSPAITKIQVQPFFIDFIKKCKEYEIKIGLSTWWREDEAHSYNVIKSPEKLAEVWMSVLDLIEENKLMDQILYLDLSNEWPLTVWTPFNQDIGWWDTKVSIHWMKNSIEILRAKYPHLPYTFSFTGELSEETLSKGDLSMLDFLEPHIWMVNFNKGEFYKKVGYSYERFSDEGYTNLALKGEKIYKENENYWKEGLLMQIEYAAEWSRTLDTPLITTECWGLVDYKDWPMLNWDWIMELCELGTLEALKTGRWVALASSNFCGPQFVGMWRDREWHQNLTEKIASSTINDDFKDTLLVKRI